MSLARRLGLLGLPLTLASVALAVPAAHAQDLGTLRAADPALVRDGSQWISMTTNERVGVPNAVPCDPEDPVWDKGFAYVPYRVGPSPDRLANCWAGDLMPNGPGPWATSPWVNLQWAPSMARIGNVWWLFYTSQRRGTGQQCIGVAASNSATGGNWLQQSSPLVCPSGGQWTIDPEIFYDRQTSAWYLTWRQDPGRCNSFIHVSRFDPTTGRLAGTVRRLLTATRAELGFDEIGNVADCPGGLSHIIENPTLVRADNGELWLFFSANQWDSNNYATGWALCGTGPPLTGAECALVNALPPAQRNKPIWGSSQRTAPTPGDPRPYEPFPDLPGYGGLSLAVADPTAGGPQPVWATAHVYRGGSTRLRTQVIHRLDTSQTVPHLVEP
jgi:arabinan endo-1,5-alpha-L-arabinosidase